jgi:hypothetical protein
MTDLLPPTPPPAPSAHVAPSLAPSTVAPPLDPIPANSATRSRTPIAIAASALLAAGLLGGGFLLINRSKADVAKVVAPTTPSTASSATTAATRSSTSAATPPTLLSTAVPNIIVAAGDPPSLNDVLGGRTPAEVSAVLTNLGFPDWPAPLGAPPPGYSPLQEVSVSISRYPDWVSGEFKTTYIDESIELGSLESSWRAELAKVTPAIPKRTSAETDGRVAIILDYDLLKKGTAKVTIAPATDANGDRIGHTIKVERRSAADAAVTEVLEIPGTNWGWSHELPDSEALRLTGLRLTYTAEGAGSVSVADDFTVPAALTGEGMAAKWAEPKSWTGRTKPSGPLRKEPVGWSVPVVRDGFAGMVLAEDLGSTHRLTVVLSRHETVAS